MGIRPSIVVVATLTSTLMGLLAPAVGATDASAKPVVVGQDPAGDWGPPPAPAGSESTGQDLVEVALTMASPEVVEFAIRFDSLPSSIPSTNQYFWAFDVRGDENEYWMLTACPADCESSGADSLPFTLEQCHRAPFGQNVQVIMHECVLVETIAAVVDAGAATITIPVQMDAIKARPGSSIRPADEFAPIQVRARTRQVESYFNGVRLAPGDTLEVTKTFRIPRSR